MGKLIVARAQERVWSHGQDFCRANNQNAPESL